MSAFGRATSPPNIINLPRHPWQAESQAYRRKQDFFLHGILHPRIKCREVRQKHVILWMNLQTASRKDLDQEEKERVSYKAFERKYLNMAGRIVRLSSKNRQIPTNISRKYHASLFWWKNISNAFYVWYTARLMHSHNRIFKATFALVRKLLFMVISTVWTLVRREQIRLKLRNSTRWT